MLQVYVDEENCSPEELQVKQASSSASIAMDFAAVQTALQNARKELYAATQRSQELETLLYSKEELLQRREASIRRNRERLRRAQMECEDLRRDLECNSTDLHGVHRLQRELSMEGEIRFWRTRYAEMCNKYGEKGVSYRSGAMEALMFKGHSEL